jgi:hypothetical protein
VVQLDLDVIDIVRGAFKGINPMMVARLMNVVCVRTKSSAVSVSTGLGRWDSAPSRPSGLPVLKKKGPAHAGVASHTPRVNVAAIKLTRNLIAILLGPSLFFESFI